MQRDLSDSLAPDPAPRIAPDLLPPGADDSARLLHAAAFGPARDVRAEPGALPRARSIREVWWRAVAHAGLGYYARAGADLMLLRGRASASAWQEWSALGAATSGSLLRQMGGHGAAAMRDGRALATVGPTSGSEVEIARGPVWRHARADALTGLAADCLGRGDVRSARRLLDRCEAMLDTEAVHGDCAAEPAGSADPRLHLRLQWVRAETAMSAGDAPAAELAAGRAREIAGSGAFDSERHQVKTTLVGAAAALVAGHVDEAAGLAESALEATGAGGLVPLRWAACLLLSGIAADGRSGFVVEETRRCADTLQGRGGGDVSVMRRYL
ncbi:MAG: hypothetical protein L0H59_16565 [Tomitella sp.]|nr:hypothetical protein [Tomitella sp.]